MAPSFRFHHIHGSDSALSNNNTTAKCTNLQGSLHSVLFSSRPIKCNETVKVRLTNETVLPPWIHFGFTDIDPNTMEDWACSKICSRLSDTQTYELREHMRKSPMELHFCYDHFGIVRATIDSGKDVANLEHMLDPQKTFWALIYTKLAIATTISLLNAMTIVGYTNPSDLYSGRFNRMCGSAIELAEDRESATCVGNDYNQRFLFSAVPMQTNMAIQLKLTDLDREEPFAFGFTPVDPARVVNIHNFHRMENNPRTWFRNICIDENCDSISWSVDSENTVTCVVNGETKKLNGCELDLSQSFWALIYLRGVGSKVSIVKNEIPILEPISVDVNSLHYQPQEFSFNTMKMVVRHNPPDVCLLGWESIRCDQHIVMQIVTKHTYESNFNLMVGLTCVNPRFLDGRNIPTDKEILEGHEEWMAIANLSSQSLYVGDEFTYFISNAGRIRYRINDGQNQYVAKSDARLWPFFKVRANTIRFKVYVGKGDASAQVAGCTPSTQSFDAKGFVEMLNSTLKMLRTPSAASSQQGEDCTICCKNTIDAVVYSCGHMCMCYECAKKQWKGPGNSGLCPLCRMPIKDVIKVFKS